MRVEIKARNLEVTEELRVQVERRLHFALSRFSPAIQGVLVRLEDVNGPRGGVDKRCLLMLRGARVGAITIDQMSSDAFSAVDLAAERAAHALARALERSRERVA